MRHLLIIILFPFFCHSQNSKSAKSVLIIGNSFSFYWNMPTLFERLNNKNYKTVVFPMHERWLDVGRPDDLNIATSYIPLSESND